ncbi:unnamed protein product [Symbiodinium natans]|uniref:Uncharacterized protein n=1 Tax=Symbiodinium natans TaxID=878477 RepID=A0A812NW29_9DINO|nr:unnamed protein product [Symbiodinium natans]
MGWDFHQEVRCHQGDRRDGQGKARAVPPSSGHDEARYVSGPSSESIFATRYTDKCRMRVSSQGQSGGSDEELAQSARCCGSSGQNASDLLVRFCLSKMSAKFDFMDMGTCPEDAKSRKDLWLLGYLTRFGEGARVVPGPFATTSQDVGHRLFGEHHAPCRTLPQGKEGSVLKAKASGTNLRFMS